MIGISSQSVVWTSHFLFTIARRKSKLKVKGVRRVRLRVEGGRERKVKGVRRGRLRVEGGRERKVKGVRRVRLRVEGGRERKEGGREIGRAHV
jgi:hypothetical protein